MVRDPQKEYELARFLALEVLPLFDSPLYYDNEQLLKKRKQRHAYIKKIKKTKLDLKTLRSLILDFNVDYKEKGILPKSPEEFYLFVETLPEYALYCGEHKRFYRFSKTRLETKITHDDLKNLEKFDPQPHFTKPYIHPKVSPVENELVYTKKYTPPDLSSYAYTELTLEKRKATGIAGRLDLGVVVLMHEPVGKEDANLDHDSFEQISADEIMRKKIPVTNLKEPVRVVYEVSPDGVHRFVQEKIWTEV